MDIQLSLVIESRIYREGIFNYLNSNTGMSVFNTFSSSTQAIKTIEQCAADIAIIDGNANDVLLLVNTIKATHPLMKIVLLIFSCEISLPGEYIALGVEGIVTNSDGMDDLKSCIATVYSGHLCYPREISDLLRGKMSKPSNLGNFIYRSQPALTQRQTVVMQLITIGFSNKEIARRLNIELSTVKNHVHQILERMKVKSRSEAAARYRVNAHQSRLSS